MALYCYKKKEYRYRKPIAYFSYVAILCGSLFLFWSLFPIIQYELFARFILNTRIMSPTDNGGSSVVEGFSNKDSSVYTTNLADYTKAASWFPTVYAGDAPVKRTFSVSEYTLSIPKLDIYDARVEVNGEDLLKGLIHFQPKVLPCEYGKVSIFGHSTHPALARFTPDRLYASIFTYLATLSSGDRIIIKVGDITCEYQVVDKFEVEPSQVSVLEQQYDRPYLYLITCTPPGTYLRRLVIATELVKLPDVQ